MKSSEFDRFADEYEAQHAANLRVTGEMPAYFAQYKVDHVARVLVSLGKTPKRVLDFGTGVGASLMPLANAFPEAQVTGIDVSQRSLQIAQKRIQGRIDLRMIVDGQLPVAAESIDLAFIACVLHHIEPVDRPTIMANLFNRIAPAGLVAIFEHNPFNPLTRRAVSTCPFDINAQLLSMGQVQNLLRNAGLELVHSAYTFFFPHALAKLRWLEPNLRRLPLGGQFCVMARKP